MRTVAAVVVFAASFPPAAAWAQASARPHERPLRAAIEARFGGIRMTDAGGPPPSVAAQPTACCWKRVKALRERQWISVGLAGGQRVRGRVISVDDTALSIDVPSGGGVRRVDRADVLTIRAEATRRMVIAGFMTAGGAGLVIANAASRPAEALPGKLWLAGAPLAIVGAVVVRDEMRRTGFVYR